MCIQYFAKQCGLNTNSERTWGTSLKIKVFKNALYIISLLIKYIYVDEVVGVSSGRSLDPDMLASDI